MVRYFVLLIMSLHLFKDVTTDEASNNLSPIEVYWHAILPNTSMPNAIRELIHPVRAGKFVAHKFICWPNWGPPGAGHDENVPAGVLNFFFRQQDIYPGAQIKEGISLDRSTIGHAFIPRTEAKKIPFSLEKLPQILNLFSIIPGSEEAKQIEKIVHDCEIHASKGVKEFCATSLEEMIDNVISEFGTQDIQVMATTLFGNRGAPVEKKIYKVASSKKKLPQEKIMLCHPKPSPQAVFYCHMPPAFKGYIVSLEANDGTKLNAIAICHYDPENFNPDYFEVLKIKPGTEPLCHFLPEGHLLWARRL